MKIRTGFVSNSSSSSFICCVCGRNEVGYDMSIKDAEMCGCVNGHTICLDELIEHIPDDDNEDTYEKYYEVAEKYCPICQFLESSTADNAAYLLKKTKIPRDEAFAEIKKSNKRRKKLYDSEYVMYACQKSGIDGLTLLPTIKEQFKTYTEFKNYIKGQ